MTGRKIIVDTYGGAARHGGGAFSGKDPTKVDRSAAYAARYVAKNVVAAGLADRCEVQVAYAIGVAHPVSIAVESFGTEHVPATRIAELVREHFDLRPGAIIKDLDLWRPIYAKTAAYGHFGRADHDFTWERTDKADALRAAAGLDRVPPPRPHAGPPRQRFAAGPCVPRAQGFDPSPRAGLNAKGGLGGGANILSCNTSTTRPEVVCARQAAADEEAGGGLLADRALVAVDGEGELPGRGLGAAELDLACRATRPSS